MKEQIAIPLEKGHHKKPKRIIGIKLMLFGKIIVPLVIGILITSFLTMFLIYTFGPQWIQNSSIAAFKKELILLGNQFTDDYKQFANELSSTAALVLYEKFSQVLLYKIIFPKKLCRLQ